jgi:hypothetical protein
LGGAKWLSNSIFPQNNSALKRYFLKFVNPLPIGAGKISIRRGVTDGAACALERRELQGCCRNEERGGARADTEIGSADPHGYKNAELPR